MNTLCLIIIFLLTDCIGHYRINQNLNQMTVKYKNFKNFVFDVKNNSDLYHCIHIHAMNYGVDENLIKAIIEVESHYNPTAVSKSNAVGLMQLKAETAGRDVYRLRGLSGMPSVKDLKNSAINIDLGTAYLSILQQKLSGIVDSQTRRYAMIVAYVNGLNALLNIFSLDYHCAIKKINTLSSDQFYQYIQKNHPSKQAKRYLSKVDAVYVMRH